MSPMDGGGGGFFLNPFNWEGGGRMGILFDFSAAEISKQHFLGRGHTYYCRTTKNKF